MDPLQHKLLPESAQAILRMAAATARNYSEDSVERKTTVERAVRIVQSNWPEFFRRRK